MTSPWVSENGAAGMKAGAADFYQQQEQTQVCIQATFILDMPDRLGMCMCMLISGILTGTKINQLPWRRSLFALASQYIFMFSYSWLLRTIERQKKRAAEAGKANSDVNLNRFCLPKAFSARCKFSATYSRSSEFSSQCSFLTSSTF